MYYLDYAAAAPVLPRALAELGGAGNADSGHAAGRSAAVRLRFAREAVARALGALPEEIYFTSGGTESDNLAVLGAARARRSGHVIATTLEHPAVLACVKALCAEGFSADILRPGPDGRIAPEAVGGALTPDTVLVTCTLCCHETGAVNDLAGISSLLRARAPGALLHTDAVQAFGRLPIDVRKLDVDLLSLSGHKIGTPAGIGVLFKRRGAALRPLFCGGEQEAGIRPGSSPVGLAAALAAVIPNAFPDHSLREYAVGLLSGIGGVILIPPYDAPHILCFARLGIPSGALLRFLSDRGVCVSAGAACGRGRRSPVLSSMNLSPAILDSALRISFGPGTSRGDLDALAAALRDAGTKMITKP